MDIAICSITMALKKFSLMARHLRVIIKWQTFVDLRLYSKSKLELNSKKV